MSSLAGASEDVTEFLKEIKGLGERRDEEDELRNKKLEEEILQGRKERQARRAERARSISPTKSSPANTPTASKTSFTKSSNLSGTLSPTIDPPEGRENQRDAAQGSAIDTLIDSSASPSRSPRKENSLSFDGDSDSADMDSNRISPAKASPSSAMPPRNSPLSWQRRPNSQASDKPRTRPLSIVATENAARSPRATPELSPSAETTLSREQIAQSLASKDPTWFRQTADRGANSPAYRQNQVEDEDRSDHGSNSKRVQLPGMSRESSMAIGNTENTPDRSASSSPSRSNTRLQQTGSRSSGLGSPVPLTSAQRFDPPTTDSMSDARSLAMSPSQGRISPERLDRPPSPTKGMGGFVQSAMMKRSDSVSKRWSVQSPPGLKRGNSIASNRSTHDPSAPVGSIVNASGGSGPNSMSRENSPRPSSRPTSSHSNATITQDGRPGTSSSIRSGIPASTDKEGFMKPALPASQFQSSQISASGEENTQKEKPLQTESTPPSSPSKAIDSRRWSPTKASWLESALNKPDSPKPKTAAPPPQQPSWMAEINKAKTRGSVDLGRSSTNAPKHDVSIGGLMRSPPLGNIGNTTVIGGFPVVSSSGTSPSSRPESAASLARKISPSGKEAPPITSPKPSFATTFPLSNTKPKLDAPLKNDFRSNLKPRQLPTGGAKEEPEFKNVFGQLRRTKTQNYVAPDELKGNITRGKAALNTTGGPKKTERVDEFKDAILKKKEDFKKAQLEGKGVPKPEPSTNRVSDIPEALVKRRNLGKVDSVATQVEPSSTGSASLIQEHSKVTPPKQSSVPPLAQAKDVLGSKLAGRFNPALAGLLARGPPSVGSETSRSSSPTASHRTISTSTSIAIESSEPGPQLTHMTKARARGPRRKAPSGISSSIASSESTCDTTASPKLSPLPQTAETQPLKIQSAIRKQSTPSPIVTDPSTPRADTETIPSQPSSPNKLDMKRRSQFLQDSPNKSNKGEPKLETPKPLSPSHKANSVEIFISSKISKPEPTNTPVTKNRPETPAKSSSLKSKSPITERSVNSSHTAKPPSSPLSPKKLPLSPPVQSSLPNSVPSERAALVSPETLRPAPLSPKKTNVDNLTTKVSVSEHRSQPGSPRTQAPDPSHSVRNAAASWARPSGTEASHPPRARSPIKLPTHDDEKAAMIGAGLRSLSPVKTEALSKSVGPSSRQAPLSPLKSPVLSQSAEASKLVTDFFEPHESPADYVTNTAELLDLRPDRFPTIKTLESTLYQFSGDGKKQLVPSHKERLLFEGNMYTCTHNFENAAGRKVTEVYFWVGDEVPEATAEDAYIYVRREARGVGGSLIKIQQGKETSEFIQALGGIVIIRRGISNKYDSLSAHMLCARKNLGQIVFDEVDYSPASLCSGFPFLISTQSGKCFLWKGRGSGIEELSCARLIGMDFGVMGDIEEIEEGQESASFLQVFGYGTKIPQSANHWKMKPNYDKYCGRLFCANSTAKLQIVEIAPFRQSDVSPYNIYILDAFFEMYIIVGSRAQSQYAAFQNALTFAQEYSILAAGMEDRPHVPITTVVLEGIPRDMKSVFRKWKDGLTPTITTPSSPGLQRGRSLRVVPLNAALEAIRLG